MSHDAIVVGAGHNGLICAAYLARAGVRTLLVEARSDVGGCASTVDALGDARVNICNCDHRAIRATPILDELDLGRHGLSYLDVDPAGLYLTYGGAPPWPLFHDVERTLDALALTHPDEVDGYRHYARAAVPVAKLLIELANEPPTPGRVLRRAAARRFAGASTLLRWSRRSTAEVLRQYFRSEALLAPGAATGPAVWGLSPELPGTGLGALSYAFSHAVPMGRPVGGSGALPAAVARSFTTAGGAILPGTYVDRLLCEGNRVRGVRTSGGDELLAPIVVSAIDPRVTMLEWLHNPPSQIATMAARYARTRPSDGYESKIDAVLAELPRYRALSGDIAARLGFDPLVPTTFIAPSLAEMHAAWLQIGAGTVAPRPIMFANLPSVLDPTMRPPSGGDIFSLEVLYTPYDHPGGWSASTEPARWLDVFGGLVEPGFTVDRYRAMTPDRYESEFHLQRGHATAFAGGPLAALRGANRELTRYETPLDGLFVTGAATFPGAGIWGASGRNAAHVVLASR